MALVFLASVTVAQLSPAKESKSEKELTRQELREFDEFLEIHQEIGCALKVDPSLVIQPGFLADHPALKEFLEDHAHARAELKAHPRTHVLKKPNCEEHGQPNSTGDAPHK
jgi:hypothetical protein